MLKIPTKISTLISIVLTFIFMAILVYGAFSMVEIVDAFIQFENVVVRYSTIGSNGRIFILIFSYLALAIAALADVLMLMLLLEVRAGRVFMDKSIAYVRYVSWCCLIIGLIFAALGRFFVLMFVLGAVVIFLGLCLRVVKNALEEASAIKSENDLTI